MGSRRADVQLIASFHSAIAPRCSSGASCAPAHKTARLTAPIARTVVTRSIDVSDRGSVQWAMFNSWQTLTVTPADDITMRDRVSRNGKAVKTLSELRWKDV